ncbi:MAG: DUF892 family protein [Bacteroidetes bacterium]|nr:DUF892 family protein [Bacteroidota bacterium]HET6246012.1 DUF892 family protein [Bacteroidia bacterium]
MKKINNLKELFILQLNDLYYTKQKQLENLANLENLVSSKDLKKQINKHLHESNQQVDHLNEVFRKVNEMPVEGKCIAMDALLEEENRLLERCEGPEILDAAVIKSLQAINHYEIATFGTACTYAKEMGQIDIAEILHVALEEEKKMDQQLTFIAKEGINEKAMHQQPKKLIKEHETREQKK